MPCAVANTASATVFELVAVKAARVIPEAVVTDSPSSLATAAKVHRQDYLDFLPTVWERWTAEGRSGTALPFCWPTRGLRGDKRPDFIDGLLGYYSFDAGVGIVSGTCTA